jgi:hypothetical protein
LTGDAVTPAGEEGAIVGILEGAEQLERIPAKALPYKKARTVAFKFIVVLEKQQRLNPST